MASDKAKVNGRRREQAEATRIGEDNRDDDEEEYINNSKKNNSNRKQGRLTGYINMNSQNFHMQTDWILLSWVLISKSKATKIFSRLSILPSFQGLVYLILGDLAFIEAVATAPSADRMPWETLRRHSSISRRCRC